MSKLSPQEIRNLRIADGNIRPAPVLGSAPLHRTTKVADSKALAIAARKAECKTQEQAQKKGRAS